MNCTHVWFDGGYVRCDDCGFTAIADDLADAERLYGLHQLAVATAQPFDVTPLASDDLRELPPPGSNGHLQC